MYIMLDHYDSFVYNLSSYLKDLGREIEVVRTDRASIAAIEKRDPLGIILSPGPGRPSEALLSIEVLRHFCQHIPILGVCLGHQIICHAFGGNVKKGKQPMHGKVTKIRCEDRGIFAGLPREYRVTRYHSLEADTETLPKCLRVDARSEDGSVMGVAHREAPIFGVQFHPEAVLTEYGHELLGNFCAICEEYRRERR
ncbi:MAG TPA: aminodeoxychorismate/anthranilate synthase component II [Candidatus Limivivens merdigallinarum]|uniref:Aminodeoxychorismate/anthranilate synthase component II n=1 Tax=Candidatus Limivivens merdigallinarum TaxID=2840859 RepID=A0A9D0ZT57_9FIRM|nr:aminodeoxychorismate/anthranilate synthase component II [Candidatus Limivivens merdigallinarum]